MLINVTWMGERNNIHFGISAKYMLDSRTSLSARVNNSSLTGLHSDPSTWRETDPVSSHWWKELQCRRAQGRFGIWTRSLMWFWIKHQLCPWRWREMNPLCFGLKILLWNSKVWTFYSSKELYSSPHWSLGTESILREVLEGMPGSCHVRAIFQFSSSVLFSVCSSVTV